MAWGEILVVQHASPRFERFVGRKDHRAMPSMTLVDDVEEHILLRRSRT
jgi:hypothetical protein